MYNALSISASSDRPDLGFTKVHSCLNQATQMPEMGARAEKSAVMAKRVLMCFSLLASLFFVMPAAAQTPGSELDEFSKLTSLTAKGRKLPTMNLIRCQSRRSST
jgi:hypothetical protein